MKPGTNFWPQMVFTEGIPTLTSRRRCCDAHTMASAATSG